MLINRLYAFNCVDFEKLWVKMLLRFQWQIERQFGFDIFGPGFDSKPPWQKGKLKMYKNARIIIFAPLTT